ncbi:unnamed protein product [Caenorhabditis auriculariae]|uniref:Fungal lipase-type domain-containing protein n=1 Tax=Caenorhabditis auriculariae TaxID=2777116 RepID=A0A8S1GZU0_9PELO|nr:unnamed protein product [Caenorhabditis auriculariae]
MNTKLILVLVVSALLILESVDCKKAKKEEKTKAKSKKQEKKEKTPKAEVAEPVVHEEVHKEVHEEVHHENLKLQALEARVEHLQQELLKLSHSEPEVAAAQPKVPRPKTVKVVTAYDQCKQECRRQREQFHAKDYVEQLREELAAVEAVIIEESREAHAEPVVVIPAAPPKDLEDLPAPAVKDPAHTADIPHFHRFRPAMDSALLIFLTFFGVLGAPFYQNPQYNETLARVMLNFASGAYGDDSDEQECVARTFSGSNDNQFLQSFSRNCDFLGNQCEGYAIVSNSLQQVTIIFRGTKTDTQLLLEGWTTLKPTKDFYGLGNVNMYFSRGHEVLWPIISQILYNPQYANYNVFFTGHSLGAALATLAAIRTVATGLRNSNQVSLITFGEPRVGNLVFAQNFDRMIPYSFRIVHEKDIIPHLPACAKDPSFQDPSISRPCDPLGTDKAYHHGIEVWYPNGMSPGSPYLVCMGLPKGEDFSCSDSMKLDFSNTTMLIEDHRHYFDVQVPNYGKTGCDPSMPEGGNPSSNGDLIDRIGNVVSKISNSFG